METASFSVNTEDWKTVYKMKYDGNKEKMLAFASLIEGTIQTKIGFMFPEMKVEPLGEEFEPLIKELTKRAKKVVKTAEISKNYKPFAVMWAVSEMLTQSGLKIFPEKKDLRKILKRI
ncbi:MAG: hypothetical protein GOV01_04075 [Candidatus Altiarchaeota archaeon]|nr:hypothetical protein [Candidatus Altiarchaeota archaeon]